MKKIVIGLVALKLLVLGMFGILFFSGFQRIQLAQVIATPTPVASGDKINRPTSNPYKGDLSRFDRENRAERLQIQKVMDILGISEGKTVADIGAGGGWFTVIAARRVGENGKVFAVDINAESKTFIDKRAKKENLTNIETIISKTDDPLLPKKSVDSVLILNTYHEISEPVILLKNLRKSLRKSALVGIIDRNGRGNDHGIDNEKVIEEAKRAGFSFKEKYDFVNATRMDYFLVFEVSQPKKERSK